MRLFQLDVLRGIAVILVLLRHQPLTNITTRMGWIGVDLFFVLSGFLVSGLLFREYKKDRKIDYKRFLIRRGLKIYPAFYILFLITLISEIFFLKNPQTFSKFLGEFFFLQNYIGFYWDHTWSLAVEEHFYLLLVLTLFLFNLKKQKLTKPFQFLVYFFIPISLICLYLRIYFFDPSNYSFFKNLFPTHLRIDSLFFGVVLSYFYNFKFDLLKKFVEEKWLIILCFSIISIIPATIFEVTSFFMNTVGLSLLYIGFGGILLLSLFVPLFIPKNSNFIFRQISKIGVYSYSIYLWHFPAKVWITHPIEIAYPAVTNSPMIFILFSVISVLLGILMAKLIEFPFLKIRNYYFPSKELIVLTERI